MRCPLVRFRQPLNPAGDKTGFHAPLISLLCLLAVDSSKGIAQVWQAVPHTAGLAANVQPHSIWWSFQRPRSGGNESATQTLRRLRPMQTRSARGRSHRRPHGAVSRRHCCTAGPARPLTLELTPTCRPAARMEGPLALVPRGAAGLLRTIVAGGAGRRHPHAGRQRCYR